MADEENIEYSAHRASGMSADAKFIHLEGRVSHLEGDVGEIKKMVKTLVDRPQNPGFPQVIGTLLATLATCAIIFSFAEWRMLQAISPVTVDLATISQKLEEAQKSTVNNRVANAILEERAAWLKSNQGWKPE